jgi:protein-disulfide isomerase
VSTRAIAWLSLFVGGAALAVVLFKLAYDERDLQAVAAPDTDKGMQEVVKELQQIRSLLERMDKRDASTGQAKVDKGQNRNARPTTAKISTNKRPSMGRADAPVTIVEVSDYQCPYCKKFYLQTFPMLKEKYIDSGKVRLVFKDLPLAFHNNARKAAQAAHCAGDQGHYWDMHNKLFENQNQLNEQSLNVYAKQIGLNSQAFDDCLTSDRHLAAIDADALEANSALLTGTPSFVIGVTTEDVITGDVVRGALPFSQLEAAIKKQLILTN